MRKRPPTRNRFSYKSTYRRNLPHIQPLNATLFVTFRLAGSLPKQVLSRMAEERAVMTRNLQDSEPANESRFRQISRRHFAMLESWLDKSTSGPTWLAEDRVARIVAEAIHYRHEKSYRLDAFSIMPNHVHAVFAPLSNQREAKSISSIMHSLKRHTSSQCNSILNRTGAFWAHENFDHYVRNDAELKRILRYVLENPVRAGLARGWRDWRWNYIRESLEPTGAN